LITRRAEGAGVDRSITASPKEQRNGCRSPPFPAIGRHWNRCRDGQHDCRRKRHVLRQTDWTTLRKRLTGDLVLPGDSDYAKDRLGYFTMYDNQPPAAIAECVGAADVQACVETAAWTNCVVAARSGSHSSPTTWIAAKAAPGRRSGSSATSSPPNWAQTYYGTNLPRLLQVARRYDPHRAFRSHRA
jgi:hypothetical protein